MNIKLIRIFINLTKTFRSCSFTILMLSSILSGEGKKNQIDSQKFKEIPWKFDCPEKRECLKKCNSMSVFQFNGKDQSYVNQLRTECFRECSDQVDCNKVQ